MGFLIETVFLRDNPDVVEKNFKPYFYFISSELFLNKFNGLLDSSAVYSYPFPPIFTMVNNKGYDYRGASLALMSYTYVPEEDYKKLDFENSNYREIIEVKRKGNVLTSNYNSTLSSWQEMRNSFIDKGVLKDEQYIEIAMSPANKIAFEKAISSYFDEPKNSNINEKEKNKVNNFDRIFKFGPASDVAMSIYGPAFKSCGAENWISRNDGEWVDVSDLLLDINTNSFCYMMPVAKSNVREGDYILHKNKWAYVSEVHDTFLEVEVMSEQELVNVIPVRNPFGFEFYTKLITPFENGFAHADSSNPFGMLPLVMMMGKNDDKNSSMLPLMLMMNGGAPDMSNPMMLMMMCDNGDNNLLPMMLMMQQMQNTANLNMTTKI